MAKQLILIRHGKAEAEQFPKSDIERSLTEQGRLQAQYIGTQLKQQNIRIDACYYSDAQRTTETFEIIADIINNLLTTSISSSKLYLCSSDNLLDYIVSETTDEQQSIAIIGHNNGLSDFYNQIGKLTMFHNLSTCETVIIQLDIDSWQELYGQPHATIINNIKPKI